MVLMWILVFHHTGGSEESALPTKTSEVCGSDHMVGAQDIQNIRSLEPFSREPPCLLLPGCLTWEKSLG